MRLHIIRDDTYLLAACERLKDQPHATPFASEEDATAFFRACDDLEGPEMEPDWNEHLRVIDSSRAI